MTELHHYGVYRYNGEYFVAVHNDDLPNGSYSWALSRAEGIPGAGFRISSDETFLFVERDSDELFSIYARHDGQRTGYVSDLVFTGLIAEGGQSA